MPVKRYYIVNNLARDRYFNNLKTIKNAVKRGGGTNVRDASGYEYLIVVTFNSDSKTLLRIVKAVNLAMHSTVMKAREKDF